ncbi:Uncharacterised protein [Mycobacteroides abscessus subsp. abscessus]|nr:Uncharacterised protein [Mycobacteroides abscessus subsp. abscessus]
MRCRTAGSSSTSAGTSPADAAVAATVRASTGAAWRRMESILVCGSRIATSDCAERGSVSATTRSGPTPCSASSPASRAAAACSSR